MNIRNAKIVPDLRVFGAANVSKEHGRKRMKALQDEGRIDPLLTPTGRYLLSFTDTETLVDAL